MTPKRVRPQRPRGIWARLTRPHSLLLACCALVSLRLLAVDPAADLADASSYGEDIALPLNIVLIIADDLRFDAVLGDEQQPRRRPNALAATPHIDALARRGVSLTNVRYMGSTTPGPCAPSRAMLLTGHHLWSAFSRCGRSARS